MKRFLVSFCSVVCLIVLSVRSFGDEPSPTPAKIAFFETRIRPVLVKNCYQCHAEDSVEVGGKLLLNSRDGMRTGGESGPAVVVGKPEESLIIQALKYDGIEMPPDKPLPEAVINDFVTWIRQGAVDPRLVEPAPPSKANADSNSEETLWSLLPRSNPPLPSVRNSGWPLDPMDYFVLARLEASDILPGKDAKPEVLVRRLYYDLIGLPPSFEQVQQFTIDLERNGNGAIERLVDELLASQQFGERWGRYWLDIARYGESNGNDGLGRNASFPHAWRYRDYVIDAWNSDTPYDQFVREQIAGDLLPSQSAEENDRHLVATGFLALTSKPAKAMNTNFAMDVVADQIDVVGRGLLGLSIACARCHDHKFDPIPTRDYYALAGIFTSSETLWGVAGYERLTAPATGLHVLSAAPHVLPPEGFEETVLRIESNTGKPKKNPKSKWAPGTPLAMGVRDRKKPADCKINIKGESKKLGEAVPRGFLSACQVTSYPPDPINPGSSGRLELARWVTADDHPLTSRVIVNRLWQHLFGNGIVRTPDDFGVYGERPSHPDLLDHLATRFVNDGWSIKRLIRSIVLSRTYRLTSQTSAELAEIDPENRLLSRHQRRRLDAEALRDSMLMVSGELNLQRAEGSLIRHRDILVNLAGNLHEPSTHRSIYLCYLRGSPPPELAPFDLPEFTSVLGKRDISTVPGQALHLLNSPFVVAQAEKLAQRIMPPTDTTTEDTTTKSPPEAKRPTDSQKRKINKETNDRAHIRLAFQRVLSREPDASELSQSAELIHFMKANTPTELKAWSSFCQALLMTNEFRYVD